MSKVPEVEALRAFAARDQEIILALIDERDKARAQLAEARSEVKRLRGALEEAAGDLDAAALWFAQNNMPSGAESFASAAENARSALTPPKPDPTTDKPPEGR